MTAHGIHMEAATPRPAAPGRCAMMRCVSSPPTRPVLAVDIGGTKLAVGVVDPDGAVVASTRCPTPPGADAEALWSALRISPR